MSAAHELVRRFAALHGPAAGAVLLAGSRARGEARGDSDYDVVLLFAEVADGAWREMVRFEGADLEVFAHDPGTLRYFFERVERPSGRPVLARMVAEGLVVIGDDEALLEQAREIARGMLERGPVPLDEKDVRAQRYAMTDMAESLRGAGAGRVLALGSALYGALANFALRSQGQWEASGKAIPDTLERLNVGLAGEFQAAFTALYAAGEDDPVQALVDRVLAPSGGRLRAGFRQQAPAEWRLPA